MSKNKKIIFGLSLSAVAFIIMFFSTMPSAGSKEISIQEVVSNGNEYNGDYVMTQGLLENDTVKWDAKKLELTFSIYEEGKGSLPVRYEGVKPDNFTDDVIVIVEGFIGEDGVFVAEKVQTKCPSKYEGEDIKDYDSNMHKEMFKEQQKE